MIGGGLSANDLLAEAMNTALAARAAEGYSSARTTYGTPADPEGLRNWQRLAVQAAKDADAATIELWRQFYALMGGGPPGAIPRQPAVATKSPETDVHP